MTANGSCGVTATSTTNSGCAQWNKKVCTKCSVRFYFNSENICIPVSDNCRDWDSNGQCTTCYNGYSAVNGSCVISAQPLGNEVSNNLYCAKWTDSACSACAQRTFVNSHGICELVSDNCNTWDKLNGACLSCYAGYDLVNGTCETSASNTALPTDGGCKTWEKGICKECSSYWTFNANGACIPVSDQCKTYDSSKGECLTCYKGYDLINGSCAYSESNAAKPTDGGCKTWDWENSKCIACSSGWVFENNGLCIPVSDQCK